MGCRSTRIGGGGRLAMAALVTLVSALLLPPPVLPQVRPRPFKPNSQQQQAPLKIAMSQNMFGPRNSEQVLTDYVDCQECVDESLLPEVNKWRMPVFQYKEKRFYLGTFFKANWFKAAQYCRYHGMHLASISSQEENDKLEEQIRDFGYGQEHFWMSGNDLAEEGHYFWMSTGRPLTFTNWNAGEPNNFRYDSGEEENCMELWNRDGKGLKWNDSACSFETYFVCEAMA